MKHSALQKLLEGKPLTIDDKKQVSLLLSNPTPSKPAVFVKFTRVEQDIFKNFFNNCTLNEFFNHVKEGFSLLFKKVVTQQESRQLKLFLLINRLMQRLETEKTIKTKFYNKLNQLEDIKHLQEASKKAIVDTMIDGAIQIGFYNKQRKYYKRLDI